MNWTVAVNIALVFVNIGILGMSLKLYTEYVKDKLQWARKKDATGE